MDCKRPISSMSSDTLSWFECLLNPHLLEDYFSSKPRPLDQLSSGFAAELINNFLSNAGVTGQQQRNSQQNTTNESNSGWASPSILSGGDLEPDKPSNGSTLTDDVVLLIPGEKKKFRALKLLALKAASFLKWDLSIIEDTLPLHMQSALLNELKKISPGGYVPGENESDVEWTSMNADTRFAYFLLYRWTLRMVISGSYPSKQTKGINVQIPGQTDPNWTSPETVEGLMKTAKDQCHLATASLENLMLTLLNEEEENCVVVRMPKSECFGTLDELTKDPQHKFELGIELAKNDLLCQLCYDLGCIYFFNKQYCEAQENFQKSAIFLKEIKAAIICTLDRQKLEGYVNACNQLLTTQNCDFSIPTISACTAVAQLLREASRGSLEVVTILLEDNVRRKIPRAVRNRMEMHFLQKFGSTHPVYPKIVVANIIRYAIEGDVVFTDLRPILSSTQIQEFFCHSLKQQLEKTTYTQKQLLKKFLQLLLTDYKDLTLRCQKSGIMEPLFGTRNPKCLKTNKDKRITRVPRDFSFTNDPIAVLARKERELLSTHRVDAISSLVKQLHKLTSSSIIGKANVKNSISVNNWWLLPKFLEVLVRTLPSKDQEEVHVLLAKAIELRTAKYYEDARQLFKKVEQDAKDSSPKLHLAVKLEIHYTDMLQFSNDPVISACVDNSKRQSIIKQAKSCIAIYVEGREGNIKSEIVELAGHILLNCQEWTPFLNLDSQKGGGGEHALEFSRLLALLCSGLENQKTNRQVVREFWDVLLMFFSAPIQYKRSSSGSVKESYREMHGNQSYTRNVFQKFVKGLKGVLPLSLILSGVIKIYNILKDDSAQELSGEHQHMWPSGLNNSTQLNSSSVGLFLQDFLYHALTIHPSHPSWLSSLGDLMFVQNHYSAALKYYISMAASTSNFFSQPLPKYLFHELQVKRMIQCCCKLQCHTQAAIITQFLEEPNYTLAFKVLGERICSDSCNSHYCHIWDVALLEFLANLHARRGEIERRSLVQYHLGLLELNANNNDEIQREAANIRKGQFLRALAKQYL